MVDLAKLSAKTALALSMGIGLILLIGAAALYSIGDPLIINGKEYGFGTNQKKLAESQILQRRLEQKLNEVTEKLSTIAAENAQLKQSIASFQSQQEKARQDNVPWSPVADVDFAQDGTYTTSDRKSGTGKWSAQDSEITLRYVSNTTDEVVLITNMAEPYNKVRLSRTMGIVAHMPKHDYSLQLDGIVDGVTTVRINRRPRT